jgi:CRP-like cAMP-binding protein
MIENKKQCKTTPIRNPLRDTAHSQSIGNYEMSEQLKKILPEKKIDEFLSITRDKSINASEYFISAGEVPMKIAFLVSGLFRYVYINDNGDEFTKGIIMENSFLSSYSAMIMEKPSYFSIEALEDSKILEISWKDFKILMESDVFWIKFLLKFVEKGYMIKEKRERDLLLLDAEKRYKNFLNEFPGMDQRIKQGIIASYLGIKPETLSRIRRKITF